MMLPLRARRFGLAWLLVPLVCAGLLAQAPPAPAAASWLLKPARVFDGVSGELRAGHAVLVTGNRIAAVGPVANIVAPAGATVVDLPGTTPLPGLIDAHSHVYLHPCN